VTAEPAAADLADVARKLGVDPGLNLPSTSEWMLDPDALGHSDSYRPLSS
jgi:hypothetical protein